MGELKDRNLLASEYQAMYRDVSGNLRFAYGINHSDPFRPNCVFGPGFREELSDLGFVKKEVYMSSESVIRLAYRERADGSTYIHSPDVPLFHVRGSDTAEAFKIAIEVLREHLERKSGGKAITLRVPEEIRVYLRPTR